MTNFPQSFEPVNSDSILEQFLQLKGNVNRVNDGMVEVQEDVAENSQRIQNVETNKQNKLTAGSNISIVNDVISASGQVTSSWGSISGTLSNQTDLKNALDEKASVNDLETLENEMTALDGRIETAEDSIITISGNVSALDAKALKTPMTAPTQAVIPVISTNNAQINCPVSTGLKFEHNNLKVDTATIQEKLTAGTGIDITNNVISATGDVDNNKIVTIPSTNVLNISFSGGTGSQELIWQNTTGSNGYITFSGVSSTTTSDGGIYLTISPDSSNLTTETCMMTSGFVSNKSNRSYFGSIIVPKNWYCRIRTNDVTIVSNCKFVYMEEV